MKFYFVRRVNLIQFEIMKFEENSENIQRMDNYWKVK